jgi:hypothetical protein
MTRLDMQMNKTPVWSHFSSQQGWSGAPFLTGGHSLGSAGWHFPKIVNAQRALQMNERMKEQGAITA